jgi:hypothetical protein
MPGDAAPWVAGTRDQPSLRENAPHGHRPEACDQHPRRLLTDAPGRGVGAGAERVTDRGPSACGGPIVSYGDEEGGEVRSGELGSRSLVVRGLEG